MDTFTIRTFQPEDETPVIDLWRICGLVVPHNDPAKDILRKAEVNPEWFLIGQVGAVIVSSCMAGYDGHRGGINYLAVHPDHQRRGYAEAIMTEAERLLTAAGCPKINLCVRTTNLPVITFYEEIGYTENSVLSLGKRLIPDNEPTTD